MPILKNLPCESEIQIQTENHLCNDVEKQVKHLNVVQTDASSALIHHA